MQGFSFRLVATFLALFSVQIALAQELPFPQVNVDAWRNSLPGFVLQGIDYRGNVVTYVEDSARNPKNGKEYYLVRAASGEDGGTPGFCNQRGNWSAWARKVIDDQAQRLGGNLVAIDDEAEMEWIQSAFPPDDVTEQDKVIWLGFSESGQHWENGDEVTFANWADNHAPARDGFLHNYPGSDSAWTAIPPDGLSDNDCQAVSAIIEVQRKVHFDFGTGVFAELKRTVNKGEWDGESWEFFSGDFDDIPMQWNEDYRLLPPTDELGNHCWDCAGLKDFHSTANFELDLRDTVGEHLLQSQADVALAMKFRAFNVGGAVFTQQLDALGIRARDPAGQIEVTDISPLIEDGFHAIIDWCTYEIVLEIPLDPMSERTEDDDFIIIIDLPYTDADTQDMNGFADFRLECGMSSPPDGMEDGGVEFLGGEILFDIDTEASDLNADGLVSAADIDDLAARVRAGDFSDLGYDLNFDNLVDQLDYEMFITSTDFLGTFKGDANLDKEVNFTDFLLLSSNFGVQAGWGEGDFNGDGNVNFGDFLLLSDRFGNHVAAATVPEPISSFTTYVTLLLGLHLRRRRQSRLFRGDVSVTYALT